MEERSDVTSNPGGNDKETKSVKPKQHALQLGSSGGIPLIIAASIVVLSSKPELTPLERQCVGSWSFVSPDQPSTVIVYHFGESRRVIEEHYYSTSATPTVPRIIFLGEWRIDKNDRLIVEAPGGLFGLLATVGGKLRALIDSNRRTPRPILRRVYQVDAATPQGLNVQTSLSRRQRIS